MGILDTWLEDLPQQFQGKQYIEALISAFSRQLEELHEVFKQLDTETDLESAVGKNLDMVGDIITLTRKEAGILAGIGVTEAVISDERYRQFLKYKILKNTNNCTYYDIMQSIEILWRTDNIKYYEDPSRPATILIKLQTIDVDSDVDPALGKTLAVKPAGVALIYTVNYIVIVDSSQLERFYFPRMRMHIALPFWGCRIFDGSWLLDGSFLLDAQRNYYPRWGVKTWGGGFYTEEHAEIEVILIHIRHSVVERVRMPTMIMRFGLDFWGIIHLSGDKFLDGNFLLDSSRSRMPLTIKQVFEGGVVDEDFRNCTVETRRNLWYLDGSLKLNGENILNAMIKKEVI